MNEAVRRSEGTVERAARAILRDSLFKSDSLYDAETLARAVLTASQLTESKVGSSPADPTSVGRSQQPERPQPDEWTVAYSPRARELVVDGPELTGDEIPLAVVRKSALLAQRQRADEAERERDEAKQRVAQRYARAEQAEAKVRELEGERDSAAQACIDNLNLCVEARRENTQLREALREIETTLRADGAEDCPAFPIAVAALSPDPQGDK